MRASAGIWSIADWLYFSDLIKPREFIPSGTCYQRLLDRVPDSALLILIPGDFMAFLPLSSTFRGQNGVITFSSFPQEFIVSSWILTMWRLLMRYSWFLYALLDFTQMGYILLFLFQPETTKPPVVSKSDKSIRYWPPRQAPYIIHKAPSILSIM
jgi:hypothetical protein